MLDQRLMFQVPLSPKSRRSLTLTHWRCLLVLSTCLVPFVNLVDNNTGVASTGGQSYLSSSSISIEDPTKAQHRHSPSWNICKRRSAYSIFPQQSTSLAINSTKSGSKVNQDQPTPHAAEHNLNLIFNYGNYSFHISLTGFSFFSSLFFLSLFHRIWPGSDR